MAGKGGERKQRLPTLVRHKLPCALQLIAGKAGEPDGRMVVGRRHHGCLVVL